MIERHSKVFVPVSVDTPHQLHVFNDDNDELIYVEEKENVYVLTEQELKGLLLEFSKKLDTIYGFEVSSEDFYKSNMEEFLQSKTNPQTENK